MKRIIAGIIIVLLSAFSFLLSAKVSAQSYLLGMVEVKFCNYDQTNKELDLVTKAGDRLPLCIEFTNNSAAPITINIDFLDSIITADKVKNRACNAADRPKTQFGNFLFPYTSEVKLSSGKTIQKEYTIEYPIGFSGLSHGCLAYNIVGGDIGNDEMFTVRIRSVKYLDILVSDTQAVQNLFVFQNAALKKSGNEYIITLGLINESNVTEKIHITSVLSNLFGFQKEFTYDTVIQANSGTVVATPSFVLPIYGGPFRFRSKISYIPQFNFNITNGKHPSEIYKGGIKKMQSVFFVRTRQSGVMIFIVLISIFGIFRLFRRKGPTASIK